MSKERLYIFDTTLRDGAQTQGVDFSVDDKLKIAAALDNLGVDYIEGGWPGANPTDTEFFNKDQIELHPCGKEFLKKRKDDNFEVVVARYDTYMETTKPILDFYSKNANFTEIDGAAEIEQITNKINDVLNV